MTHATVSVQPAMVMASEGIKLNMWSSGVCDCCEDMGICCCGLWCSYCLMCKTSEEFGECLCLPLLEGSIQNDCCVVCCCPVCVWCQMARELKARKRSLVVINQTVTHVHQQPIPPVNVVQQPAYNPAY
ncbi:hypothetical protein DNTS_011398 [Danionella cerebrum]|uniref:Uncharacterized protein n=1 Tax=Danionella cerebrum TaxID=2873325 RepID=A0A553P5G4_9TELE|nr:hypothetical protein DNTS_011398 [Danionella translucida]